MDRIYIDHDMAHFVRKDITLVDVQMQDGTTFQNLEPRRLFPTSNLRKFITLLDEDGVEQAVIRDLDTLPEAERDIIEDCLNEYYLIPKIIKILDNKEKYGVITLSVNTDKGPALIEIRNVAHAIKFLQERRVLIRDHNDNRYEIPDIYELDWRSRQLIDCYL